MKQQYCKFVVTILAVLEHALDYEKISSKKIEYECSVCN